MAISSNCSKITRVLFNGHGTHLGHSRHIKTESDLSQQCSQEMSLFAWSIQNCSESHGT
jgi:hypothetical protein